jgi:hypothetical protein
MFIRWNILNIYGVLVISFATIFKLLVFMVIITISCALRMEAENSFGSLVPVRWDCDDWVTAGKRNIGQNFSFSWDTLFQIILFITEISVEIY